MTILTCWIAFMNILTCHHAHPNLLKRIDEHPDLLKRIHALVEDVVPHHDHDDGAGAVHQGQGAVLQLPGLQPLAVHVRQLLHLHTQIVEMQRQEHNKETLP
jgi:hypothetical protein